MQSFQRLVKEDLTLPCKEMALYLIGKVLVRKLDDGTILKGRIVETECYPGGEDKASVTVGGRRTPACEPLYMPAGTAFVYMTYGMYHCFNISTVEPGGAVLLRALHPIDGLDAMEKFRTAKRKGVKKALKNTELCAGPSKLCMAMDITKENFNAADVCTNNELWIEDDGVDKEEMTIVKTSRIGIARAGVEWASKPFRFYIFDDPHVSKRDKGAEKDLIS